MIVDEPPYDLVVVFADADAQQFFEQVIERGQERHCLRPLRWRSLRDPRRDTLVHAPLAVLDPWLLHCDRFLLLCDHHGSGRDELGAEELEASLERTVQARLGQARELVAIVLAPELEAVLVPVWERIKELLAAQRGRSAPADEEILLQVRPADGRPLSDLLQADPRLVLRALFDLLQLRPNARQFTAFGNHLSLPKLKVGRAVDRCTATLQRWFAPV